jgi:hypothetical protein
MIQSNVVNPIEKRYKISKRLGNEIQLLKSKCDGTNNFNSKTNLLIERYMKLIRKYEQKN